MRETGIGEICKVKGICKEQEKRRGYEKGNNVDSTGKWS